MAGATPTEPSLAPRPSLLLLCGLPGSGKSTLARWLASAAGAERLRSALGVRSLLVHHLCFDAIVATMEAEAGASEFQPELWHAARERALQVTRERLDPSTAGTLANGEGLQGLGALASSSSSSECLGCEGGATNAEVLVLDDNFYYRSMRRPYYKLARERGVGLAILCLDVDADVAVARDARRSGRERVGETTIRLMEAALQWPGSDGAAWEAGASLVIGRVGGGGGEGGGGSEGKVPTPSDEQWERLGSMLGCAVAPERTEEALRARQAEAEASALATSESATHQLDLRLRRLTSTLLTSPSVAAMLPAERAPLGRLLAERKREALLSFRRRHARRAEGGGGEGGGGEGPASEQSSGGWRLDEEVDELELEFARLVVRQQQPQQGS